MTETSHLTIDHVEQSIRLDQEVLEFPFISDPVGEMYGSPVM